MRLLIIGIDDSEDIVKRSSKLLADVFVEPQQGEQVTLMKWQEADGIELTADLLAVWEGK